MTGAALHASAAGRAPAAPVAAGPAAGGLAAGGLAAGAELPFTDADFARIAAFAHREFGLHLAAAKKDLVYSRLLRRLRQAGCPDFAAYCALLEQDPQGEERAALISALTTNVTHFFREEHHFTLLADLLIRPQVEALRRGQRLRLWSAGCSAGQEACSMAMTLLHHLPDAGRLNLRILATDIDAGILARARAGDYPLEEMQSIPPAYRPLLAEEGGRPGPAPPGQFRMPGRIRDLIRFAELNLMEDWPVRGPFDAIFCRNVAIYFDKPTQARLWKRLADLLAPGGLLCIGHSERVDGPASALLTSAGITAYRRSGAPGAPAPAPSRKDPRG